METNKKTFNKRAFISSGLFISGLLLPLGWLIHFTDFKFYPKLNEFWMSVHNAATTLFVVFLIIHLIYNWKAMQAYITKSKTKLISKETLYAAILVVFIVGLFSSHVFHN
jgi:succinate dehydrogenase hydrophobic anchor subunit